MENLRVFDYRGSNVRTVTINGQPWFLAKNVCDILELANVGQALSRLDSDEKNTIILNDGTPGNPNVAIVNEPGLYSLILSSRKPEARDFKRWVTHEVLPQIRQTGVYVNPQSPAQALLQAVTLLAEQEKKLQLLEHRINTLDGISISGDRRQQLNQMVKKYAHANGYSFSLAWKHFTQAYNAAYRTNLALLKTNHGKGLSTPAYLEAVDKLDDALRVADKMLNQEAI